MLTISNKLKRIIKNEGLKTTEEYVFALLIGLGWDELDAYIVSHNPSHETDNNYAKNRAKFIKLDKNIDKASKNIAMKFAEKDISPEELDSVVIMSKEQMAKELQIMYNKTNDSDKRQDIMKQIADLLGMKKEVMESEDSSKVFYLTQKCSSCTWYKGREKDKLE